MSWSPDSARIYVVQSTFGVGVVTQRESIPGSVLEINIKDAASQRTIASMTQPEQSSSPLNFLLSPSGKEIAVFGGSSQDTRLKIIATSPRVLDLTSDSFSGWHADLQAPPDRKDEIAKLLPWAKSKPGIGNLVAFFVDAGGPLEFKIERSGKTRFVRQWNPKGVGSFKSKEVKFPGRQDGLFYGSGDASLWSGPVKCPGKDIYVFAAMGSVWVYRP
jgi:hypothetical protein